MIISASYRTDIPALYGPWFLNRLEAGYCKVANPYGGPPSTLQLTREAVDGFVFWTRNVKPFLPALERVRERGWPFVVQYTVTGYPRALESGVAPAEHGLAMLMAIRDRHGPRAAVWRYDPIVFSSLTDARFHRENFGRLAGSLAGVTDEVVLSFAQMYRKTKRNLDRASASNGFDWRDPDSDEKGDLLAQLREIAAQAGMRIGLCGQRGLLRDGIADARCIDELRLGDVGGSAVAAPAAGHREACGCAGSRDIGAYDSCTQGCAYCYAVRDRGAAQERQRQHDPMGEFLLPGRAAR